MRDYLNATEKNQLMSLQAVLQMLEGVRNGGTNGPKMGTILEQWSKSNNITKEEHKNLKSAETFLRKFLVSVYDRLSPKEQETFKKKLMKYDFKLVDDYTLKQVFRDITDRYTTAAVPRNQFNKWTEEIMCVKCQGCMKDGNTCELRTVFDENFIPESGWNLPNCKFAYTKD